jgi:hypothetical protein
MLCFFLQNFDYYWSAQFAPTRSGQSYLSPEAARSSLTNADGSSLPMKISHKLKGLSNDS